MSEAIASLSVHVNPYLEYPGLIVLEWPRLQLLYTVYYKRKRLSPLSE